MSSKTNLNKGRAVGLLLIVGFLGGCAQPNPSGQAAPTGFNPLVSGSDNRSASGASYPPQGNSPILPDPRMTPGAALPVTTSDVCVSGYSKLVRDVPQEVKKQVYAEYGITSHQPGDYEVDHLISLELGGSNSIKNLWPQSYRTQPWNAHVKDALENRLHEMACAGQIDLPTAQREIATNWIEAYKKYFHSDVPVSGSNFARTASHTRRGAGQRQPGYSGRTAVYHPSGFPDRVDQNPGPGIVSDSGGNNTVSHTGQVWVNASSGKYFLPGSHWYGATKRGEYMTEEQAKDQGYRAAQGE